jgi:predicted  nucleic acid-binding Zn-ribbon protein
MRETYEELIGLQDLDSQIDEARRTLAEFQPRLDELEAPVDAKQKEVETVRGRLNDMKAELRRLERGAEEKRATLKKYEDRMARVRNAREEAAARTEIDLVRHAAEADEDDAVALMEQATKLELKLDEMEKDLTQARQELEPRRAELLEAQREAQTALDVLKDQRENRRIRLDDSAVGLYDRVRSGRTRVVLARLTKDGACGHCFSMIPIQQQNEIREDRGLHRCEACGVILYADD